MILLEQSDSGFATIMQQVYIRKSPPPENGDGCISSMSQQTMHIKEELSSTFLYQLHKQKTTPHKSKITIELNINQPLNSNKST